MNDKSVLLGWLCFSLLVGGTQADERNPEVVMLRPGVQLTMVAQHPALSTPTGIDVDDQGRVWVVATHTHFRPEDYVGPEHDEILVFSAFDDAGRAQDRRVFYNATDATMDLELGADGWVYLAERDRIMRVKDTNGDGQGDTEEVLVTLTSEADYPHNGLEGLAWHPNGDLIFALGENFAKPWTLTGPDGGTLSGTGEGGIFRCSADGQNLSRFAYGFWNPFGVCVRGDGEVFAAENDPGETPPCRLLHIVEGGDYGYQRAYGSEAQHPFVAWNGELRGTLPMIHPSGEAPCGVLSLGRGLLVPSWSDHRIDFFRLKRAGASFSAERIPLLQGSRYFRPSCIASGGAGEGGQGTQRTWFLSDWVDGRYQAHGYGRLWRLDIDLDQAEWVGPLTPEPLTEQATLAQKLRREPDNYDRGTLLELSRDQDPFLARAALLALSRKASTWKAEDVSSWPAGDRIQAVLALKLSGSSAGDWPQRFLSDENADVQFEALRWIADAHLKHLLSEVEQFQQRSDLDYRRFEAAIATLNTLHGNPEAGVRNPELLLARVQDDQSPPQLRAFSLRLLPTHPRSAPKEGGLAVVDFPKGLSLELLQKLLNVKDETLSLEAIRTMAGNPLLSQEILAEIAADVLQSLSVRVEAIAGLAAVAEGQVEVLTELAQDREKGIRDEALRSLRGVDRSTLRIPPLQKVSTTYPDSAELVEAVVAPDTFTDNRPATTDTKAWLSLLAAVDDPVDLEQGRRIFHHARITQCSNCHRHNGRGNVVGPDLSNLGNRKDRHWLVQSILEPSRDMAPEYQPRTIVLKDGRTFTGIRLRSYTKETIRDTNGQNRTFDRDEVEAMVESTVSFMPKGVVNSLTIHELRDLIAFLENSATE